MLWIFLQILHSLFRQCMKALEWNNCKVGGLIRAPLHMPNVTEQETEPFQADGLSEDLLKQGLCVNWLGLPLMIKSLSEVKDVQVNRCSTAHCNW